MITIFSGIINLTISSKENMRDISDSFLSSQLMLLCIFSVVTVHVATVAFFLQSHMALGFEPLVGKRCFSIASQE